jgi:PAS domain-containing protein
MGDDSYSEIFLRRLSIIFTAIFAGISFIAVTGWIFDRLIIARISNSYIPMSPVSALSFLMLSGILFFHFLYPYYIPRFVNKTVVIFVFFLSSIILIEHFSGAKLDIERFLSREPGMFGSAPMGRMSPYTAATMLLACISLFLLFSSHLKRPYTRNAAAGTGIVVATMGLVFVMDYLYGTLMLYGGAIIPVALNTAMAFVFLGLSLITSAGPYSWPTRLMIGPSVRARLMRSFLPFPVAILLVYGLIHSYFFTGTIDSAMASSFIAILSLVILSIAITRISDIIGGEIEQAITERKQSEKKLFESEQKYRRIVDTANEGIWAMDEDFVATYVNKQMADMLGYKQEEIMGTPINAFMFEEDLSDHQQKIQTRQQGISAQYERR